MNKKKINLLGKVFGDLIVLEELENGYWKCRCSCGKDCNAIGRKLREGKKINCSRCLDLEKRKFGFLTVINQGKNNGSWIAKCICGQIKEFKTHRLITGHSTSCGCRKGKHNSKDLLNLRFGRWTVIREAESYYYCKGWLCQCDCGKIKKVPSSALLNKTSQSCGCLQKESASKLGKISNRNQPKGANNWNWKGGATPVYDQVRKCTMSREWIKAVLKRDGYECQHCGSKKSGSLRAHHIIHFQKILDAYNIDSFSKAEFTPGLWEVGNGITLCEDCHKDLHSGLKIMEKMQQ